ncbi:YbaB/EbfC family nucleoid-associated protein [Umezawaea endophytica]|uniref:YbaB/EbfC family nucleoid-associated protein n=1 Tax=Umezawaea endophytica TaxID=1654476 RepID=A0A9X3AF55_9PSEU|nr:YbaB/EbfC family nucleoid-associated protein [Umezawaea endophytica]MCS7476775.1 YbaB/EbfC family nucleoid-associated protein [Umezawaea endophytica]
MIGGGSPEQVERQLEEWARQAEQKAVRYQQMGSAVSAVSATESTPDGMVRVTVNSSGALSNLELTDRISEHRGAEVAAQVMACVQRAQGKLAAQVSEAMQATIGDDQPTIDTVVEGYRQRFPEPVEQQPDPDAGYRPIGGLAEDDDWDGGSILH